MVNSTILPLLVLGISDTSNIFAGTCLTDVSRLMLFFTSSIRPSSNSNPGASFTNNTILMSSFHFWPTATDSRISS